MTSQKGIPRPLRRHLLIRAALGEDRDKILRTFFPVLDNPDARVVLDEAQRANESGNATRAEALIAELIMQDLEAHA